MFGGLEIVLHGSPLPRSTPAKVRLLLAMLAVQNGEKVHRNTAAARLWTTKSNQQQSQYLNRTVWQLRKVLGAEAYRLPDAEALARELNVDWAGADVDVHAFDSAIKR